MSLTLRDKACYSLSLVPSPQPDVLYLVENYNPSHPVDDQQIRYGRVREPSKAGEVYSAALYDAFSQAKLASTGLLTERVRSRRLQLHGPDEDITFEFTGKLGFEWTFQFEGNKYMWKRSGGIASKDLACFMDRRRDPSVDVALGRVSGRDRKPAHMSILHYNIERFIPNDIKDLRGLETLLVLTFTALVDSGDMSSRQSSGSSSASRPQQNNSQNKPLPPGPSTATPNPPPEVYHEDANEVVVGVLTDLDSHIDRAISLLEDPNMLFIIIRTKDARAAQRALQVVLGVNRFRHRGEKPDLHQYVLEEEAPEAKGPRRINLNDAPADAPTWKPPPNLAIYLSTIELPDLKPGGAARANSNKRPKPVAQVRPASMVGSMPTLSTPVPPQHHTSPNLRPVSPSPSLRPVSPNPYPNSHVGMLNAPAGGSNRPASISGSVPNLGYVPPVPPPSNFHPSPSPSPSNFHPSPSPGFQPGPAPSGFQPGPAPSGFQPQPQAKWGPPGFSGGYSESPFLHGLFRPNHKH
ncbi:hypothetical protein CcaverHIS002_0602910 [Cutaneotrichosporon cavernicola]|uniref:Uncharacterized protein n=1 Tax=Cutaneotrichosporon cavernicola TaxID=279322 RepID=A0AA48QXX4_9TREE|nr:uncharacterized protein CcaverHIS019_0602390 [Cutaneotrichosporon cavernicola]BEI86004.1 hypothetical protein CcaverHIS002_0602910 [Cutaneotrichosporon cavernicola]BEI93780.1 hypothetical protein CcaverHIS019_0602390 [Cutaneotrichosporon cavernicola]BEJ01558.1 hypothetical protein CcaverHIS631_0602400 [Cutaneotrichosporon cavernicola]BEJ09323.1 hypothetical protein CcaverHIS641_0602380 [Cutaneotrichosporon cavernicola]